MRCECCDAPLSDSESTARFVNKDPEAPVRYVNMCKKCTGFLPPDVHIHTRRDLSDKVEEPPYDPFDLGDLDDEAW